MSGSERGTEKPGAVRRQGASSPLYAGGRGDLLDRGALGTLEHLDHPGLLGAGAGRGLRARLGKLLLGQPINARQDLD
jgi:hypothetical protein